jgi:Tfp pilus assembly protein FimT
MVRLTGHLLVDWSAGLGFAATALMFAVPGLKTFVHETHRSAVVNDLQLTIRQATSAANQTAQAVVMCAASADGARCAEDENWSGGWVAFVDVNANGEMDGPEQRLVLSSTRNSHAHVAVVAAPATLTFQPFYAQRPVESTAHIVVCDRLGRDGGRRVDIDRAGVPSVSKAPPCGK